jgi:hypothetical protein
MDVISPEQHLILALVKAVKNLRLRKKIMKSLYQRRTYHCFMEYHAPWYGHVISHRWHIWIYENN